MSYEPTGLLAVALVARLPVNAGVSPVTAPLVVYVNVGLLAP